MKKVKRIIKVIVCLVFVGLLVTIAISSPVQNGDGAAPAAPAAEKTPKVKNEPAPKGVTMVEFSAGSFPADSEEIAVVLAEGETALLDEFTALKSADLHGSTNYEEIQAWEAEHPKVKLSYGVTLPNGETLEQDAESAALAGLGEAQAEETLRLLAFLPKLKTVDITGADFSGAQIAALKQSFPELELTGTFTLLGQEVDPKVTELDLTELSHDGVESAAKTLALLSELETISLGSSGDNDLTMDDIALIEAACPDAAVDYHVNVWGRDVSLADEMLDLNHIAMDDQGAAVRSILPYMTRLKVLDMDSCGVSNENMAVIRDENPDVDVVWRVWFGSDYSVRTNVTCILASKPSKGGILYDSVGDQLKYCTKVRYLDLGHNSDIYDFNFVRNMPDLEIVVISMTGISDLSPFADCTHLKYMEAGNCRLSDLSPLAACKELRHLNVGTNENVRDITALYDLDLKRLWLGVGDPVPVEQVEKMRELHPDCEVNTTCPTGKEKDANGNQTNEGYVTENWKCYQQYLAADWAYWENNGGVFPAQRPLGWWKVVFKCFRYNLGDQAYAFSWNDPKYNEHGPDVAPVNTRVIDTSFLDEDFEIPETIIPDKLDDPPGDLLYESTY